MFQHVHKLILFLENINRLLNITGIMTCYCCFILLKTTKNANNICQIKEIQVWFEI